MIASRKTQQSLAKKFLPVVCRTYLDRPQVLLEAPRRRPVDVVARGRAVLDAARGHVEGIRLHRVAGELLVQVRIEIPEATTSDQFVTKPHMAQTKDNLVSTSRRCSAVAENRIVCTNVYLSRM